MSEPVMKCCVVCRERMTAYEDQVCVICRANRRSPTPEPPNDVRELVTPELLWLAEAALFYLDNVNIRKMRGSAPFEALLEAADSYKFRHGKDFATRHAMLATADASKREGENKDAR